MTKEAQELYEDMLNERLEQFDMHQEIKCGAPCCIAGHCAVRAGLNISELVSESYTRAAAHYLGIPLEIILSLCYPYRVARAPNNLGLWSHMLDTSPYNASQKEAAEALRKACLLAEDQG